MTLIILFWLNFKTITESIIYLSTLLGIFGFIKLFYIRIFDKNLAPFSTYSHYFNLIYIGLIYITLFIWLVSDNNFQSEIYLYFSGLLTFKKIPDIVVIGKLHIFLTLIFFIYLPFTFLFHFISNILPTTKYAGMMNQISKVVKSKKK